MVDMNLSKRQTEKVRACGRSRHRNLCMLVIPARFERTTYRLGICRSIQLSYGTIAAFIVRFARVGQCDEGQIFGAVLPVARQPRRR